MKEKAIIFSTAMVKAILEGSKTMTRRTQGLEEINKNSNDWICKRSLEDGSYWFQHPQKKNEYLYNYYPKPRYQVGDMLWVKETWYIQPELWEMNHNPQPIHYKADGNIQCLEDYILKPSIFMPKWASRITLEVVSVKAERLQDISEEDAIAEGTPIHDFFGIGTARLAGLTTVDYFAELWDSLDKKYPWASNPWCFVYSFKRHNPQRAIEI